MPTSPRTRSRFLRGLLTVTAVTSVVAVSACGSSDSSAAGSGAAGGSAAPKALKIGVSYPTANNPFWDNYTSFIQDGAKQLGATVTLVSADNNETKQLNDVENLISQGVDGLIVTPQSTSVAQGILRAATQRKIPVVVTDRYPGYEPGTNKNADYLGFIGPNDVQAGKGITEALAADGAKNLLAVGGTPGSSVAEGRKQGLDEGVAAAGATIVQYQAAGETQELGQKTAENLLQANPKGKADGIWCYNDALCMGAIKAVKDSGRASEFKLGGLDLSADAVKAIQDGTYDVSFGGHWLQGGFGLVMLYDSLNGKQPKQPVTKLNLLKVDKTNVAKFVDQYVTNPPTYDFKQLSQVTNPAATGTFDITLKQ